MVLLYDSDGCCIEVELDHMFLAKCNKARISSLNKGGGWGGHQLYAYLAQETYLLFTHYYFLIVQFCSIKWA